MAVASIVLFDKQWAQLENEVRLKRATEQQINKLSVLFNEEILPRLTGSDELGHARNFITDLNQIKIAISRNEFSKIDVQIFNVASSIQTIKDDLNRNSSLMHVTIFAPKFTSSHFYNASTKLRERAEGEWKRSDEMQRVSITEEIDKLVEEWNTNSNRLPDALIAVLKHHPEPLRNERYKKILDKIWISQESFELAIQEEVDAVLSPKFALVRAMTITTLMGDHPALQAATRTRIQGLMGSIANKERLALLAQQAKELEQKRKEEVEVKAAIQEVSHDTNPSKLSPSQILDLNQAKQIIESSQWTLLPLVCQDRMVQSAVDEFLEKKIKEELDIDQFQGAQNYQRLMFDPKAKEKMNRLISDRRIKYQTEGLPGEINSALLFLTHQLKLVNMSPIERETVKAELDKQITKLKRVMGAPAGSPAAPSKVAVAHHSPAAPYERPPAKEGAAGAAAPPAPTPEPKKEEPKKTEGIGIVPGPVVQMTPAPASTSDPAPSPVVAAPPGGPKLES